MPCLQANHTIIPRTAFASFLLATGFLVSSEASAQVDKKAAARSIAVEGIKAAQAGDCAQAVPKLEQAEQLYHSVVHLRYLAECASSDGNYVAATEYWRSIIQDPEQSSSSSAVKEAIEMAPQELRELLPKLAQTRLVPAESYNNLTIELDGVALDTAMLDIAIPMNPGEHQLTLHADGYQEFSTQFSLVSGEEQELVLRLEAATSQATENADQTSEASQGPNIAAWSLIGGGILLAGAAFIPWASANSKTDSLLASCDPSTNLCDIPQNEIDQTRSDINTLDAVAAGMWIGSGALVAGGIIWLLVDSSSAKHESAQRAALPLSGSFSPYGGMVHWRGSF